MKNETKHYGIRGREAIRVLLTFEDPLNASAPAVLTDCCYGKIDGGSGLASLLVPTSCVRSAEHTSLFTSFYLPAWSESNHELIPVAISV